MLYNQKPTEDEIIQNSKTGVLYTTDFQDGKYFQVVFEDETGFGVGCILSSLFAIFCWNIPFHIQVNFLTALSNEVQASSASALPLTLILK